MTGVALVLYALAVSQARRIPLVLHVAALSQVLPVLSGLRYRSRLPPPRIWTIAWCLAGLAGDGLQLWLRGSTGNNNLWVRAAIVPIGNAVMLWTLSLWQRHAVSRLAFRIAIPIFLIALLALIPTVSETRAFDTVAGPFQSLLLLAGALYTLVTNAARDPEGVTVHDWFWITLGASLYFGLRVALPPFAAMLIASHQELVRLAYLLQAWADIVVFLLIARGIWCPLPQAHSGGFFSWQPSRSRSS
jgi:hypothetical protein